MGVERWNVGRGWEPALRVGNSLALFFQAGVVGCGVFRVPLFFEKALITLLVTKETLPAVNVPSQRRPLRDVGLTIRVLDKLLSLGLCWSFFPRDPDCLKDQPGEA